MKNLIIFKRCLLLLAPAAIIVACGEATTEQGESSAEPTAQVSTSESIAEQESNRWYTAEQVNLGAEIFATNCAVCHGPNAEGTVEDWRQRLDDGSFPPPPLNGSAHAWHHPTPMLLQVINNGGEAYGGQMPPFADVLEDAEKLAAVAYFQNFWTDEIYSQWEQMGGAN